METKILQLTQLYAQLELIYLEMLTLTQGLQDLCAASSFLTEIDRGKLAELLSSREKLMEQAAAKQKEAGTLELSLRESLQPVEESILLPTKEDSRPVQDRLSSATRRLELLVKEIIALDMVTGQALKRSLQQAAREIGKIQTGKKANKAYQDQDFQSEGFFIDFNK